MTAPAEALKSPQYAGISLITLDLLAALLEELIRENNVCERAQLIMFRIAGPICALAEGEPDFLINRAHPARQIFELVAAIAKLSGDRFSPGDALYKTTLESIQSLQVKRFSADKTLAQVSADLMHVHRLARIRAPIALKRARVSTSELTDAKMIASLYIVKHCDRFDVSEALLYFVLTDWLALMVVTVLQTGQYSDEVKELDRLTFMLLYMATQKTEPKHEVFFQFFPRKLKQHILSLESDCHGHKVNFKGILAQVDKLL